jgi:hypothetical protein
MTMKVRFRERERERKADFPEKTTVVHGKLSNLKNKSSTPCGEMGTCTLRTNQVDLVVRRAQTYTSLMEE